MLAAAPGAGPAGAASPLDPSFGDHGVVRTQFAGQDASARAVAVQRDAKIVVAGNYPGTAVLVRYRPNGRLDPSFGTGGIVKTSVHQFGPNAITLQRDGKIVATGTSFDSSFTSYATLARYLPSGKLDSGFGTGGIVQASPAAMRDGAAVLVQRDGKIVMVGAAAPSGFAVARFMPNGRALDTSFDGDGYARVPADEGGCGTSSSYGATAVVLAGSSIVAGGYCGGKTTDATAGILRFRGPSANDGAMDHTFGSGGTSLAPFPRPSYGVGLVRLADGRLVQGGEIGDSSSGFRIGILRTRANGFIDSTFGTGGTTIFTIAGFANSFPVALDRGPTGALIVAAFDGKDRGAFAVARRTSKGAVDRSFGSGGQASTAVGSVGPGFMSESGASALAIQPDDRAVVAGSSNMGSDRVVTVVRFRAPVDRISKLAIRPKAIVPAKHGGSLAAARKRGGVVSYSGTEPATTTLTVQRVLPRRHGHKRRYRTVGSFKHRDGVGATRFRFTGRIHHHRLKRGHYRLRAVARNSGGKSKTLYARFRVK